MDPGQPGPDGTMQWHVLGCQMRPGPSSSSAAHGKGQLAPMPHVAARMAQPGEEKTEEKHKRSSKQGGLMQKGGTSAGPQALDRPKAGRLGCRKGGLA